MSGVASMGSLVKLQAPTAAAASVSVSMSQRCATAKPTMRSSRRARTGSSVFMRGAAFLEIGLDEVALLHDDLVAGREAGEHFRRLRIAAAQLERARLVAI